MEQRGDTTVAPPAEMLPLVVVVVPLTSVLVELHLLIVYSLPVAVVAEAVADVNPEL